jgi:hypothetical protein
MDHGMVDCLIDIGTWILPRALICREKSGWSTFTSRLNALQSRCKQIPALEDSVVSVILEPARGRDEGTWIILDWGTCTFVHYKDLKRDILSLDKCCYAIEYEASAQIPLHQYIAR